MDTTSEAPSLQQITDKQLSLVALAQNMYCKQPSPDNANNVALAVDELGVLLHLMKSSAQ